MKWPDISKKMLVTALLPILLVLVMCFHHIPKLFHEIIGIVWFLLIIVHIYQHRQWFGGLRQGAWHAERLLNTVTNILLFVLVIVVIGAGAGISNYLFREIMPLDIQRSITIHQFHVSLAYGIMLLCGIHWGLHWKGWLGQWKQVFNIDNAAGTYPWVKYCLMVILILGGIYSSIINQVGDRLLMKHIFATAATALPGAAYAILIACLLGLYVLIGMVIVRIIR